MFEYHFLIIVLICMLWFLVSLIINQIHVKYSFILAKFNQLTKSYLQTWNHTDHMK